MRKISILNRQRFTACLFYLFYIFLLSGCGGGSDDNLSPGLSETGSASFNIAWHDAPVIPASENILMPAAEAEPVDCGLIENIICEVRDESDAPLTSASFLCSDRQGTINDIPVGTNRKFVILGEDEGGNILYHGVAPGITISADQTNDVGTIDTYYFVPTGLSATTASSSEISLTWNASSDNVADVGYNVYRDGDFLKTVISTSTSDTGRVPSTLYCYTVSAYDAAGNGAAGYESEQSSQDCATTDPPPTNPPPTPNPMTWATEPYATTTSAIAMVATTASDLNTPINYFFDFVNSPTGGSGGTDSLWQSSTSYSDSGLGINQQYGYLVRARDGEGNATVNSSTSYAYTLANTPGYPSGGPFSNVTETSIRVTWAASGNPPGTQYYCENMDNGTNSGWTTNLYWDSTGLSCGTSYEFRVMARNGDDQRTDWRYLDNQYTQVCTITFDLEEHTATATTSDDPRPGSRTNLSSTKSGITIYIYREGGKRFDTTLVSVSDFGNISLDPFYDTNQGAFIVNFSVPVASVSVDMGDYNGGTILGDTLPIENDDLLLQAYINDNATGAMLDSDTDELIDTGKLNPWQFNYRTLSVGPAVNCIKSIKMIGGNFSGFNSVFYDNIVVERCP
jgi:hypothetical protein